MLAWIDTETTGLKPEECALLEVALVVTDNDLNEVHAESWVLPYEYDTDKALTMHQVVREMHAKNGLWAECAARHADAAGFGHALAETEILATLRRFTAAKEGPICGSTIAFDRRFLEVHMPSVAAHFSHRNLDVSVLGELAKLWAPDVYAARPKVEGHRALPDIRASIEAMRYYRANLSEVLR